MVVDVAARSASGASGTAASAREGAAVTEDAGAGGAPARDGSRDGADRGGDEQVTADAAERDAELDTAARNALRRWTGTV